MKVQNIKHEMKHNGLERLLKKVPSNMHNDMYIGGVQLVEDWKIENYLKGVYT